MLLKAPLQRVWPSALLIAGLALSVGWAVLIGYGFTTLIGMTP